METFESVFMALPDCCCVKNPNSYQSSYTAAYKDRSKHAIYVHAGTPKEAVIRLAEVLAEKGIGYETLTMTSNKYLPAPALRQPSNNPSILSDYSAAIRHEAIRIRIGKEVKNSK